MGRQSRCVEQLAGGCGVRIGNTLADACRRWQDGCDALPVAAAAACPSPLLPARRSPARPHARTPARPHLTCSDAKNIKLVESAWPADNFVVEGELSATFESLPAGSTVQHT